MTISRADSIAGVIVYNDKFAYSHHATDPAGGKLCNAFDLVRWHLFTPGTNTQSGAFIADESASISAMRAYAAADEATRIRMTEERIRQAE